MSDDEGERHPDNPAPSGPPTHWVDTDVMLEVYSHGDLYTAYDQYKRGEVPISQVEYRRVRNQGSLWMAMALCTVSARSITYQHENLRNILRLADPDTPSGAWTSTILYMLGDHGVFNGWERHMTNIGETLSDRDRDRLIVKEAKAKRLVLVTRDGKLTREARAAGLDAVDPETFAARHITWVDACRMFAERLRDAAIGYLVAGPSWEHEKRTRAGNTAREVYASIWQSPNQPWFK